MAYIPDCRPERVIELEKCVALLRTYAVWQIQEGETHQPTLPSAIARSNAIFSKDQADQAMIATVRPGPYQNAQ